MTTHKPASGREFCRGQQLSLVLCPWEEGRGEWATDEPRGLQGLLWSRAGTGEMATLLPVPCLCIRQAEAHSLNWEFDCITQI